MLRLFIALDLPESLRNSLSKLRRDVDGVRWVPREQLHVTLRFVGNTPEERLPGIESALGTITSPPLDLTTERLTPFPSRRRATVLAATIARTDELVRLQRDVEAAVVSAGFEPGTKHYRPHITLARLKRPARRALDEYLDTHDLNDSFSVGSFSLYSSVLLRSGARHEQLKSYPLGIDPTP